VKSSIFIRRFSGTAITGIPQEAGGAVKIISCIEDPVVIKKILDYLDAEFESSVLANQLLENRFSKLLQNSVQIDC